MEGILLPCCSIFFSALLCFAYFFKKRVNLIENKMYGVMLVMVLIDSIIVTVLHWFGLYSITDTRVLMINVLNKIDFILLTIYLSSLFMYVALITISNARENYNKFHSIVIILDIVFLILIILGEINIISDNGNYSVTGSATSILALAAGLYIVGCILIALFNIKRLDKRHMPIAGMVLIISLLLIITTIDPYLIVISISLTFLNYIMYFTIENPDVKMLRQTEMAKDQAERANRAKSDFLSSMSHEIRTPLNAIVGLSEDNLSYKDKMPKEVVENSQDIINASQTLLEIVGNILDINKIESNKMEITLEKYNPTELITSVAKIDRTRIGDKPIKFVMDIADDIPYELIGDRLHITQILNNLLSNAFKYTDEGSVNLKVSCINEKDICNLVISVQDTGRGIKTENLNKMFNKFERLDIEKNTTAEGTGLGLAITKQLVEMMGGKINVQSHYGKGTLFVVKLPQKVSKAVNPLTDTQIIRLNEIRKRVIASTDYSGKKVLVVDDNKLNIKVARKALEGFNLNIDECYDGDECIDKIKKGNKYDLILMDIMMPNKDGETTLEELKNLPDFNIPVIAITADAVAGAKEKYLSEGFVDYIAKPFSKEQIRQKLDGIFRE